MKMHFQIDFLKISQNTLLFINSVFVSFLSILIGFFFATTLSTILGQTGDWGILSSGLLVAFLEILSKFIYDSKRQKSFLKKNQINANIHIINGSVEIAPNIGLADAICDIVSSGSTLFKNNLKEVVEINTSEAVLVQAPSLNLEKQALIEKLKFRIQAVLRAKKSKYILMNLPNDKIDAISSILPVLKSPTVLPLAKSGWSSLHSVINAGDFWEVIDALKANGAEDILVCPIEKMVL